MQVLFYQPVTPRPGDPFVGHIGPWPTENPAGAWASEVGEELARAVWSGSGGDELIGIATRTATLRLVLNTEVAGAGEPLWGARTQGEFDRTIDALSRQFENASTRVLLRPTSAGMLSDIPSVLRFARRTEGARLGLLLEPSALLAESMLAHAEDHAVRIGEALAPLASVEAVFLSGIVPSEESGREPALRRCPAVEGAPGVRALRDVVSHARAGVPIVVAGPRTQLHELGLSDARE